MKKNITRVYITLFIANLMSNFNIKAGYDQKNEFGLTNPKNQYCYMNATLQCLYRLGDFNDYILKNKKNVENEIIKEYILFLENNNFKREIIGRCDIAPNGGGDPATFLQNIFAEFALAKYSDKDSFRDVNLNVENATTKAFKIPNNNLKNNFLWYYGSNMYDRLQWILKKPNFDEFALIIYRKPILEKTKKFYALGTNLGGEEKLIFKSRYIILNQTINVADFEETIKYQGEDYNLIGIVVSQNGTHATAFVKKNDQWKFYNDSSITNQSPSSFNFVCNAPYKIANCISPVLLFYENKKTEEEQKKEIDQVDYKKGIRSTIPIIKEIRNLICGEDVNNPTEEQIKKWEDENKDIPREADLFFKNQAKIKMHTIIENDNRLNLQYSKFNMDNFIDIFKKITELNSYIPITEISINDSNLNKLPSDVITELSKLKALSFLDFSGNNFGSIPILVRQLNQIPNLAVLTLKTIGLKKLPNSFGNLKQLTKLDISNNEFEAIPKPVFELSNLRKLELSNNPIKKIPDEIKKLKRLEELTMFGAKKLETISSEIGELKNLKNISICGSKIKELPESFGNLEKLEYLMLNSQNLEKLPKSFKNLKKLKYIYIDENTFKNSINEIVQTNPEITLGITKNNEFSYDIGTVALLRYAISHANLNDKDVFEGIKRLINRE